MKLQGRWDKGASLFAWAPQRPFAGLYYPGPKVNRLRIGDPDARFLGAKAWFAGEKHPRGYVELWTGADSVFEQVERWIGPGEAYEATCRYVMTEGIGKATYAGVEAAVHVTPDGKQIHAVTYEPVGRLSLEVDGEPVGEAKPCGPTKLAAWALEPGERFRVTLSAGGEKLLSFDWPVKVAPDEKAYAEIRRTLDASRPINQERLGDSESYGRAVHRANYPPRTVGRGRVRLRLGRLDAALATLLAASRPRERSGRSRDAARAEASHLLGATLLELGKPAAAQVAFARAADGASGHQKRAEAGPVRDAYPPARYYLAVLLLGGEKKAGQRRGRAVAHLEKLLKQNPRHWEGRLLRAYLLGLADGRDLGPAELVSGRSPQPGPSAAEKLAAADPADPRALWVFHQALRVAEKADEAAAANKALDRMLEEPGARKRLDEFIAATKGEYVPLNRTKEWDAVKKEK